MSFSRDRITGIVLSAFSLLYLFFSKDIKVFKGSGATPLTSAFMPRFWGTCLLILGLLLIFWGGFRRTDDGKADRPSTLAGQKKWLSDNREVVLTFVLIGVYSAFLPFLGFTISSALFIFGQILILTPPGKRRPGTALLVGIFFAVLIDSVFVKLIGVLLPKGILGF
ncbi:MAG: tripartite tricarboxylate transporter TctB family protein [Aminobacteriaceae bacterium]